MKVQNKSILIGSNRSTRQQNRLALPLSILTGLLLLVYSPAAISADAQATDPSVKQDKEPFAVDKTPPDMVVDERTEMEILRDLADSLRKLDHATTETVKEVNRHAPAQVNMQDVVTEQVLNPFMYDPWDPALNASLRNGPLLPPRKKWLDFDVSQVVQVVGILQHEVSSLCPPVSMSNTARDSFKVELGLMTEANGKIQSTSDQLKQLAQGPNYDNEKIGKAAHDIRTAARTIEECRKRAVKALSKK
ncbi:MAG: hypothetical protein K2Y39_14215 [Candidatus Obscuribacterales bacterium]|nr:hypothetical protein [Candidatus Obscuribacterales bacterium]